MTNRAEAPAASACFAFSVNSQFPRKDNAMRPSNWKQTFSNLCKVINFKREKEERDWPLKRECNMSPKDLQEKREVYGFDEL